MNSETLHIISIAFFVSGLIFLTLTIVFAIKFELLSIIKSNMKIRKERAFLDGDEYFAYVENKKKNSYTYSSKNKSEDITESVSDDNSGTVLQKKEESNQSATVIRNGDEQSNVTVIVSKKPELKKNENDFIIVKEIMVINGNPNEVTKRHLSR